MKHKIFISVVILEMMALLGLFASGFVPAKKCRSDIRLNQQLVKQLMLTDLSIWTEARYTRHPSQTDFFTPFQDFPSAIEHFPAGSIVAPPQMADFFTSGKERTDTGGR